MAIIISLCILLTSCSATKKSINDTNNNSTSTNDTDAKSQSIDTSFLDNIDTSNNPFQKGYYDY